MSDEPICKLCGHHADSHRFRLDDHGGPICVKCPDRTCQDGADGVAYRDLRGRSASLDPVINAS